jgi:uncharacterized membrane protein YfbV (UPF0208 family)
MLLPDIAIQLIVPGVDVMGVLWQVEEAVTSYATAVALAGTVTLQLPCASVVQVSVRATVCVPAFLKVNVICNAAITAKLGSPQT